MIGRFVQEPAPELPGTVEGLPTDWVAWSIVLAGAGWLAFRGYRAWREIVARRREAEAKARFEKGMEEYSWSILMDLDDLISRFAGEDEQAGTLLAKYVRLLCSELWQVDCASFADAEILQEADRHLGPGKRKEKRRYLEPLLRMATDAMFARRRFTRSQWRDALMVAQAWERGYEPGVEVP